MFRRSSITLKSGGKQSSQTIRFLLVGGLNTIVGYGCYIGGLALGLNYFIAMLVAHIIGVTHSFFWNKYWTFQSKGDTRYELLKFILVYTVTFGLNSLLLMVFVETMLIEKKLAQVYALFIVTFVSFLGHKLWSFRKASQNSPKVKDETMESINRSGLT